MIRKILFLFVLCLPSFAWGQEFVLKTQQSYYGPPADSTIIPIEPNQAVLVWRIEPRGINDGQVVSVRIVSSVRRGDIPHFYASQYGWFTYEGLQSEPGSFGQYYTIIDSDTLYLYSGSSFPARLLQQIQSLLVAQNLGTVEQRAAYIASFKLNNVSIIDTSKIVESIVAMLGPWANIGIGIAIALFAIDFGTRKSKKLAGQAAKEARAAERREINKEIRQDPVAAQFRTYLGNLSSVIRDTYGLHGTDSRTRREARALFEQAAKDYAAYKKYRGWTS